MTTHHVPSLLPTGVVGSWAVPPWLDRVKAEYFARHIGGEEMRQILDTAIKAAVKDQELAGVDVLTDGELRRDNMVDHFLERIAGVEVHRHTKDYYYDYHEAVVRRQLPATALGLSDELTFTKGLTDREVKFSVTGPHTLVKQLRDEWYHDEVALARDVAISLNAELRDLVAAGATFLQIDEPSLSGYPEDLEWAVDVHNVLVEGVEARIGLHICFGNRYRRPSWAGSYRFLFPRILDARFDQLLLEFARTGTEDLDLFKDHPGEFSLGMGVVDVKDDRVESPEQVAALIRRGLEAVTPDRLWINPDCGLQHLAPDVAVAKLRAMVEGAAIVRHEVMG
jgi:5-methyltetrahydropteroyltriglutamate--homocysteine methyltransferase